MTIKVFQSLTSTVSDNVAERQLKFEEMGISSTIEDEEVEWLPIKIRFDKIIASMENQEGFDVFLEGGEMFYCKDDPFKTED